MVSIWELETYFKKQDIVIIGSGFTGLWSALFLKRAQPKARITILERGLLPMGASTRNAGFACFGSLSELLYDNRTMGTDAMLELVEMRFKGLALIEKEFGKKRIGLEWNGGYELYAPGDKGIASLKDDMHQINQLLSPITGSKKTFRLSNRSIKEMGFGNTARMVLNKFEGGLHSGQLLQALVQEVSALGVTILTGVEVKSINGENGGFELHTNLTEPITAKKILHGTNAFASALMPQVNITPARGQVLLTSPIEDLPFNGTFHAEEGYYYFRNLGKRVLLGGARHKDLEGERSLEMTTTARIQGELEQYLDTVILPRYIGKFNIERRWSGIMGMGESKMPTLKEIAPGQFCAVGMGGMGVALAPVAGKKMSRLMID